MIEQAILHTDGGSRGNPGPSGIGYELLVDDGRGLVTISEGGAFIGEATNNVAEYQALIWGLGNAIALDVRQLNIRADSELLVKQIKGEYRVKNEGIRPLHRKVMSLLETLQSYRISHVYRSENTRADALANEAMDKETSVGNFQISCEVSLEHERVEGEGTLDPEASEAEFAERYEALEADQFFDEVAPVPADGTSFVTPRLFDDDTALFADAPDPIEAVPTTPVHDSDIRSTMNETSHTPASGTRATETTGIYTLTVKNHFDAAHALIGYPGECKNLHGHTWDIEATVSGTQLDEVGIVYDFKALKSDLSAILDDYDHHYLNEVPPFDTINATAENLARIIYERLEESLPEGIKLEEIAVWESPIAKLTYRTQ